MGRREDAYRKWQALGRVTTERGATAAEASTAAKLAASLGAKWGFARPAPAQPPGPEYDERFRHAEQRAAQHFGWEYRTCGKPQCRCFRGSKHGPYKYGKKRRGSTVVSIYLGR